MELADYNNILPLTEKACDIAAKIYADLRKAGTPLDDIDLLIADIVSANNLIIATRNVSHFNRINGLAVENWYQKTEPHKSAESWG